MKLFVAFAAPDRDQLERLKSGLAVVLGSEGAWSHYEREIALSRSAESIAALAECDLLLALMSPDFLAWDYCMGEEFATAINLHEAGELRIVPVILEACEWKVSRLGRLKSLPKLGAPISECRDPEEAYREVAAELGAIVQYELAGGVEVRAGMGG